MTIYAKQVPPEYQISTFDYATYENIILTGNRNYMEYWPKWAENIGSYMEDALSALYYIQSGRGYYDSWEDVLADLLTPHVRTHRFARTLVEHNRNAKEYQVKLNKMKIR